MDVQRNPGGGGNITCRGYGYVPPIWVGFWVQNSLNKGPFFGKFSLNIGGLSRNWEKIVKNGKCSAKIHHKSGYDGNCPYVAEGSFLKTGLQTPSIRKSCTPPPPSGSEMLRIFINGRENVSHKKALKVFYIK